MTFYESIRDLAAPSRYMARHSRSFRFAAAFMNAHDRERLARVYAWCRFTDDIVDNAAVGVATVEEQLDDWLQLSRAAYDGYSSGIPLVDSVMREAADSGVPFRYANDLVAGVRSDLHFRQFEDVADLKQYTYRVAGVVGRWLTQLFGVHDRWTLERAERLGHALQFTNIVRDVGEDWDRRRVYVPYTMLRKYGLLPNDLGLLRWGARRIDARYRALLEEIMALADREYAAAWEAIDMLPGGFRRSVAVAAAVYRGIHHEVRRSGYDNVTRRAATSLPRKLILSASALFALRPAQRAGVGRPRAARIPFTHTAPGRQVRTPA